MGRWFVSDAGAERVGEGLSDGEAEAAVLFAAVGMVGAIKSLEKMGGVFGRNTGAVVADAQKKGVGCAFCVDADVRAGGRMALGVVEKNGEDLAQRGGVAGDGG